MGESTSKLALCQKYILFFITAWTLTAKILFAQKRWAKCYFTYVQFSPHREMPVLDFRFTQTVSYFCHSNDMSKHTPSLCFKNTNSHSDPGGLRKIVAGFWSQLHCKTATSELDSAQFTFQCHSFTVFFIPLGLNVSCTGQAGRRVLTHVWCCSKEGCYCSVSV